MARIQSPPILSQIRGARSYSDQAAALRALKNEIVGHTQKKEKWVELGVLDPVVKILANNRPPAKLNGKESRIHVAHPRQLSDEESVRLQALQLLASFANGGPSFLAPIHAAGAIPVILSNIFPLDNPPQIVLTALRALHNITEAAALALPLSPVDMASLAEAIFAPRYLDPINLILTSTPSNPVAQSQISLVAGLISRLCREEQHQNALANAGILDALATVLASFVVAQGQVVPGAEICGQSEGLAEMIPEPASPGTNLTVILEAISAIIADSRFRACMLLYSPAILAIFPTLEFAPPVREARSAWIALEMAGFANPRPRNPGAMDYLLPIVPVYPSKAVSSQASHFPPLGFSMSRENLSSNGRSSLGKLSGWDPSRFELMGPNGDTEGEEPESPLVPWLVHQVVTSSGMERIMAASVLTSLYKAGFANTAREASIGVLVIPPLLQLLDSTGGIIHHSESVHVEPQTALSWAILERAPSVLARLVADSELLQKAAYESGAIKVICKLLKDSYEPLPGHSNPRPWSPTPDRSTAREREGGALFCRLGPSGQLPLHAHRVRLRESALKAIAAMISFKDEYRKAFVEQDVVPYVAESLTQTPSKPKSNKDRPKSDKGADVACTVDADSLYGSNPVAVVIAACHIVRMLSRSVSILRTSLEDHGVAMPIFHLLRHADTDVQIAACGAVCNLVVDFSPMRERFTEAGILKILCEHAHSLNAGLRLNALWALKHLVHAGGVDLKKTCLEELEPGWLVRLICDDTEDEALFTRTKTERRLSADDMDEDMEMDLYEEESRPWLWSGMYRSTTSRSTSERSHSARMQKAERRLSALREAELNPVRKARNDDLAIQEQGLNFIRNLIGPAGSSGVSSEGSHDTTEMIDYVFSEIGQDRLFEILASKLRVKVLHPFSRRFSGGRDSRVLYPQAKIIEAVVCILVHMAASVPRHRQLVISQTDLLKLLVGHFSSKDKDVRVALCHLIANLVWQDDSNDAQACAQRALELKRLGFLTKLEALEQEDGELDVRERAKTAIWQMKQGNL